MEGGTTLNNAFQNNNNEVGDGMQCIHHPHRTNPSGICAFCLQEKLGKLVSSSFPLPPLASSSSTCSSSSPSSPPITSSSLQTNHHQRLPNNKPNTCTSSTNIILKRSKSTATPKRNPNHHHNDFSPRKRNGFWSFLYPSSKHSLSKPRDKSCTSSKNTDHVIITTTQEENNNNKCVVSSSLVSRSRSVGCGSRSFSGDFFERISSGLGDCTLRRVESQREGKPNLPGSVNINRCLKERVRCGGIFGGFVMTSSSSSSSCSWVSSSAEERKSWGWTFASPIRAFGTKGSSKRNDSSHKNATPNLSAIPSLLAVRG